MAEVRGNKVTLSESANTTSSTPVSVTFALVPPYITFPLKPKGLMVFHRASEQSSLPPPPPSHWQVRES